MADPSPTPENNEAKRRADLDIERTATTLRDNRSSLAGWADPESPAWKAFLSLLDGLEGTMVQEGSDVSVRVQDVTLTGRFAESLRVERVPVIVKPDFNQPLEGGGWKARIIFSGEQADNAIVQLAHELTTQDGQSVLARMLLGDSAQEQRAGALRVTLGTNVKDPTTGGRFDQAATRQQVVAWLYCCQTLLDRSSVLPAVLNLTGGRTLPLEDRHVGVARTFGVHLLSSMALELALKLGIEQDSVTPAPGDSQGHNLARLASKLSKSRHATMQTNFEEYLHERGLNAQPILDYLRTEKNTFVEWRYASELTPTWRTTRQSIETDSILLYGAALATAMTCFNEPSRSTVQT